MPMPKQLEWAAYCSAPPLKTLTLRPPQISRDAEALCPRAPLRPVKREVNRSLEVEGVELVVDEDNEKFEPVAQPVKIEEDPRQLRVGLAAISLRPPPSSASTSSEEAGPSRRTAALCQIPGNTLGPAEQPRGRGRPKGSKSRPRICFGLSTPPERVAKLKRGPTSRRCRRRRRFRGAPSPIPPG